MNQPMTHPALEVTTTAGLISVEVYVDAAPKASAYVLDLVRSGAYNKTAFFRSTTLGREREPLIQGGPFSDIITGASKVEPDVAMLDDFDTTRDSGLRHVAGAVSLARDLFRTGAAISDWFICLDDYPDLDFDGRNEPDNRGFAVFGTVIDGLDIVRSIASQRADAPTPNRHLAGQILAEPVEILTVTVVPNEADRS